MKINNKKNILVILFFILSGIAVNINAEDKKEFLDKINKNIISGGVKKDAIPAIEQPIYVDVKSADKFIEGNDFVFVVEDFNGIKIYPQKIMVWHEIVNDTFFGKKGSITYCPLTGSAIGYFGKIENRHTSFGISGNLVNSNLVMYDRNTGSLWPQIMGTAVKGSLKGKKLDKFQIYWVEWEIAKKLYANAKVLSHQTGYARPYGYDPYGSYKDIRSYYKSGGPMFPLMNFDKRLKAKELVVAFDISKPVAVLKNSVVKKRIMNINNKKLNIVAIYDKTINSVRIYKSRLASQSLKFVVKNNKIYDKQTSSEWNIWGKAINGKLENNQLENVSSFEVFWFAWIAYYPESLLIK